MYNLTTIIFVKIQNKFVYEKLYTCIIVIFRHLLCTLHVCRFNQEHTKTEVIICSQMNFELPTSKCFLGIASGC